MTLPVAPANATATIKQKKLSIHQCCLEGDKDAVISLLAASPNAINSRDDDERLPLHWACTGGHVAICSLLLDRGANIDAVDDSGWTVFHIACSAGREQIVDLILSRSSPAALKDMINAQTETGQTALHYAASKAHTDLVKRLLSLESICPELTDSQGQTALHRAASKGLAPVCRMLLNNRRQLVDMRDRQGNTALHLACEEDRGTVADMLISEFNARADIENKEKKTAIQIREHRSPTSRHPKMTEQPAAAKPDPGLKEDPGATAAAGDQVDSTISIKVSGGDGGHEYIFKLKRTTPLRKVMDAYCQRVGKNPRDVRFCFDGERLNGDATPEAKGMENDDVIDALIEQHGGYRSS